MYMGALILFLSILIENCVFTVSAMRNDELDYIDYRRLFCPAELPKFPYGPSPVAAWPYGLTGTSYMIRDILREEHCDYDDWSWRNFTTLTDLCSAQGNPNGNMGGSVRTQK